jgi:hypothetical protein
MFRFGALASLFSLVFVLLIPSVALSEKTLTNEDIIKLSKVGLGDEAITAKVRQATEVDFRLETDDLAKLKSAGVSGKVIAAMLDRSNGNNGHTTYVATPAGVVETNTPSAGAVKLVTSAKTIPLTSVVGDSSSTYVYVTVLYWMNFPSLHAANRTSDKSPSFIISTDRDPRSRYYVVRLDANEEDGDRSLKMGRSGAFSFKAGTVPDSDWTFPFDAVEERHGVWKATLKKTLPAGEYGVYVVQAGELFDFGVD